MSETKGPIPSYQESYNPAPQQNYPHDPMNTQPQPMMQTQSIQQPMQMQEQSQYRQATPLQSIGSSPAPVDCPSCGTRQMTRVDFESGNTTYAWALGLCVCLCLGCIPFLMTSLKDVVHYCGHCGIRLATWHRSGRVEVQAHA